MITSTIISYGGWKRCLRIANGSLELVVTLDVGPRIIRCALIGDKNLFVEYPDQMGKTAGDAYHSYGGHRLWIAPEEKPKTYFPDNRPVEWIQDAEWFHVRPPAETSGFQKEINIRLDSENARVRVLHRISNVSKAPVTASVWALSVMAPGGTAIFPHEPFQPHPDRLLPVRPLVFWSYTEMTDPRWAWGKRYIQLTQSDAKNPQKIGAFNSLGWAAYLNEDRLFLKRFPAHTDATYPDFGCNCEIFTNHRMLEVESLGPLRSIAPGESLTHEEQWFISKAGRRGDTEEELQSIIEPALTP